MFEAARGQADVAEEQASEQLTPELVPLLPVFTDSVLSPLDELPQLMSANAKTLEQTKRYRTSNLIDSLHLDHNLYTIVTKNRGSFNGDVDTPKPAHLSLNFDATPPHW
jgi:hypothetical protein